MSNFANEYAVKNMYKNRVPHGISFLETKKGKRIEFLIFKDGTVCESCSLSNDANVKVRHLTYEDTLGIVKTNMKFAEFRGKLDMLFQAKTVEFWMAMTSGKPTHNGLLLTGNGFRYEGLTLSKVLESARTPNGLSDSSV